MTKVQLSGMSIYTRVLRFLLFLANFLLFTDYVSMRSWSDEGINGISRLEGPFSSEALDSCQITKNENVSRTLTGKWPSARTSDSRNSLSARNF